MKTIWRRIGWDFECIAQPKHMTLTIVIILFAGLSNWHNSNMLYHMLAQWGLFVALTASYWRKTPHFVEGDTLFSTMSGLVISDDTGVLPTVREIPPYKPLRFLRMTGRDNSVALVSDGECEIYCHPEHLSFTSVNTHI